MEVKCAKCSNVAVLRDERVPLGKSYILCPRCRSRINIFKGVKAGSVLTNLTGVRFSGSADELMERFCEPGEFWRVVKVLQPCPEKGKGRSCEMENKGRCPNQRLMVRLRFEKTVYKTCLYRKGRRIFGKGDTAPVGRGVMSSGVSMVEGPST